MSYQLKILSFEEAMNLPMMDDNPPSWGPSEPYSVTYTAVIKAVNQMKLEKQKKEITKKILLS